MVNPGRIGSYSNALRLRYFDIARDISLVKDNESLQRACISATKLLGYDYYLFGGYYPVTERIVISSSFPDEWRNRYEVGGYIAMDPTVKHCWAESSPVVWQNISYSEGKVGELERKVMEEAFSYGLRSGISVPVHGAGTEGCMLSLASQEEHADYEWHMKAGLQIIAYAVHDVAKQIMSREESANVPVMESLSRREVECLSWTAKGKTSWDISMILEVSENTVTFHLRNAIRKLEVSNRSQAVAKAISLSKIAPF